MSVAYDGFGLLFESGRWVQDWQHDQSGYDMKQLPTNCSGRIYSGSYAVTNNTAGYRCLFIYFFSTSFPNGRNLTN